MAQAPDSALYEDLLPVMAEKLGAEQFVSELCKGFRVLADPSRGVITAESLHRNSALLGTARMTEEQAAEMVKEGDVDGDGALDEREFCVLMVRLSPEMMEDGVRWLEEAIAEETIDVLM
ncbi:calcium-binding protein KIC-like [Canna indica]|uniref:Calcium-binding protein KIC-like n=1 Tax=Canna indica TaxID=4628 RepID=A0AAQ3Q179_9LILI|nr:calcium-binding protein KIC-like [Canna indica]